MMKNKKKIAFFAIVMLLVMILPAFGQPKIPKAPANIIKTIKAMGGVTIGNWWSDYDVNTYVTKSEYDEKLLDYRKKLLKENDNIVIRTKNIASWNEMSSIAATSIMAGKPAAQVFVLQPDWALSLYRQNLLYPVSDNKQVDLKKTTPVDWNKAVTETFTFNKKIYAFQAGYGDSHHAAVLVWNKRLFREAGLNPDLPYDLQKSGKWTWDEFLKLCKQLTRDTNNDGKMDTYSMPRDLSTEILDAFVSGNGAMYVDRNSSGKLINVTNKPAFIEAVQFFMKLRDEKVMLEKPQGAAWNWHIPAFNDGKAAMRIDQHYIVTGDLQNMKDDWGMVLPPKGPKAKNYVVFTDENVMVVPNVYNKDQVDAIMWAVQAWLTPVDDNWKASLYQTYRDRRAIDETWALIRDPKLQQWKHHLHVPGLNRGAIAWEIWYHDGEAAQLVEAVSPMWNALIEDANDY